MMNNQLLFKLFNQFMQNPNQILDSMEIPEQYRKNSNDAIQYLMNNGKVTQEQYNIANNRLKQLRNNPLFRQFFEK